jgi:hypothetical protein
VSSDVFYTLLVEAVGEYYRSSWNMVEEGDRAARGVAGWPHLATSGCPSRSGVFYTLLVHVSSWIILVIIDTLILFLLF